MTLNLDRTAWTRVRLGDVVHQSKDKVDPADGTIDRYIAGEHMDTGELRITRWGDVGDGYLGPAFHRRFRSGQILYGSRRTYLRKVAVADFDGVCANTTFVLEPQDEGVLSPDFLPFVMSAERFHEFAIAASRGSVNPYVNWSDIARYDFDLPPLDEQHRIADLLWALERHREAKQSMRELVLDTHRAWLDSTIKSLDAHHHRTLGELISHGTIRLLTGPFGSTLSAKEFVEGGVPVIHPSHIRDGRATVDPESTLPEERAKSLARWQVAEGDIVLMRKGDVGRSAIITADQVGWVISSDCISIRLHAGASLVPEFLRLALAAPSAMRMLLRNAPGTTMPGINERSLQSITVPALSRQEQELVVSESGRLRSAADVMTSELRSLLMVRSALLDELFGGNA